LARRAWARLASFCTVAEAHSMQGGALPVEKKN
jgi:hypothetical protein